MDMTLAPHQSDFVAWCLHVVIACAAHVSPWDTTIITESIARMAVDRARLLLLLPVASVILPVNTLD